MLSPSGLARLIVIAIALWPALLLAEPPADPTELREMSSEPEGSDIDVPACLEEADPSIAAEACGSELAEGGAAALGVTGPELAAVALTGAWQDDPGRALEGLGLGPPVSPWRARMALWLPRLSVGVVYRRGQHGRSAELWLRLSWTLEDS